MNVIIPAILPSSQEDLDAKIERLRGITDEVQIDCVDGKFIGPPTWPYGPGHTLGELKGDPALGTIRYEVDLMVNDPEASFRAWTAAGATRIAVHVESEPRLAELLKEVNSTYGHDTSFATGMLSFGLALSIDTDTAVVEPFLKSCDFIQFMGIARIGRQGEPFDRRVLRKMRAFHEKYPDMPLQVDGGVSRATIPDLVRAGASRLVIGSAFWNAPDLAAEYASLEELTKSYGWYA